MSKSWEQILGGYATDTLTEAEKHQLFEAALHDQELFDALADEEALKALLANSEARQRILAGVQASGNLEMTYSSPSQRLDWFRKPSSLAWVGSVAAMGLALIFGWQMEKDWGPIIQEEQEMKRAVSQDEDHDNNEERFQSQASETVELKEKNQDSQKQDKSEPERVAGVSAPIPVPQRSSMAKSSKPLKRMRQPSTQVPSKGLFRQEVKKERRLKVNESMSQTPLSAIVQNVPEEEPKDAPPLALSEAVEKSFQQLPQSPVFADKLQERDAIISPSGRELFYANQSRRVDAVEDELADRRAQQLLEGLSSQREKALPEEAVDLRTSREVVQNDSQGLTRGIRYSFLRRGGDGKDEVIDITKFSGKWSELYLTIESNVSGHLYAAMSIEKGKWQLMIPESLSDSRSEGAIPIEAYQPVKFALSQVTSNRLVRPVASSITLLLSSTPLTDFLKWLGRVRDLEVDEGSLIENTTTENFVIDSSQKSETPLRVNIALE